MNSKNQYYKSIPDYKCRFRFPSKEEIEKAIIRHCYYSTIQFEQTFGKNYEHKNIPNSK